MTNERTDSGAASGTRSGTNSGTLGPADRPDRPADAATLTSSVSPTPSAGPSVSAICPFLATASGAWRAAFPVSEHRCTAVVPAVRIAPAKQRRLCLAASHETCATYLAALELRASTRGSPSATDARMGRHRPIPSTTPVLLERPRPALPVPATMQRGVGQLVLVALLAVAFVAIFFARLGSAPAASPGPTSSASAAIAASPTTPSSPSASAVTSPSTSPSASPTPVRTPRPSVRPSPHPSPSAGATGAGGTYTVKSGDTLSGIASRFGTTVKALAQLNGLVAPYVIHPGQVLQIP